MFSRPGLINSTAGLISTVINIYSAQDGNKSITAQVTLWVTGGFSAAFLILFALYNFWALKRVKSKHSRELEVDERGRQTEHESRGPVESLKRRAKEPGLDPSSVV